MDHHAHAERSRGQPWPWFHRVGLAVWNGPDIHVIDPIGTRGGCGALAGGLAWSGWRLDHRGVSFPIYDLARFGGLFRVALFPMRFPTASLGRWRAYALALVGGSEPIPA